MQTFAHFCAQLNCKNMLIMVLKANVLAVFEEEMNCTK
jgi:hypothetical protein